MSKISEILKQGKGALASNDDLLALEILLAFALGKSREFLISHSEFEMNEMIYDKFQDVFSRYLKGEPIAYLTNQKEFFGLNFYVDKRVLIPRPETEILVEKVIEFCKENLVDTKPKILDVGTGSGNIALSLAKSLPNAQVTGVDISDEALEVATINRENFGLNSQVQFFQSNLMESVKESFDVVVANLPYIGKESFSFVSKAAVDYEPNVALFGGNDGLMLYNQLFEQISCSANKPQLLLGEFGFLQREEMETLLQKYFKNSDIKFVEDYAHIERVFMILFPR